jgi:hypothetical protein
MRHFTWAVAWFLVGLTVTLGTASVLQQVVSTRQAAATPAIEQPTQGPAPTTKPPAEGRDLVVATRRFNREH